MHYVGCLRPPRGIVLARKPPYGKKDGFGGRTEQLLYQGWGIGLDFRAHRRLGVVARTGGQG